MRALFFTPFAGILQHSFAEATLAKTLAEAGVEIDTVTCAGAFRGQCITLAAQGKSGTTDRATLDRVCRNCTHAAKGMFKRPKSLNDLISKNDPAMERQISDAMAKLSKDNLFDFEFEGLPIGKFAAYQHLLKFKKNTLEIFDSEWPVFATEVANCLKTYFAMVKYIQANPKPDIVFIYNTLYSVNAVVRRMFEEQGVDVYSLHAGPNLRRFYDTLTVTKKSQIHSNLNNLRLWPKYKDEPLSEEMIGHVEGHYFELLLGRSVFAYSKPSEPISLSPKQYFRISSDQRVVLVAMSSYDEYFAVFSCGAQSIVSDELFPNQIEWVEAILNYAQTRNDLFFIIRIHPRELPNKREGVQSEHSKQLFKVLEHRPANVAFNLPSDPFSIYQIAAESSLVLTSWSSVGVELTLLGLPVLVYTENMQIFPGDLVTVGRSRAEYFSYFDSLIKSGWQLSRSIKAFRWHALDQDRNCIHFESPPQLRSQSRVTKLVDKIITRIAPAIAAKGRIGKIRDESATLEMLKQHSENPINFSKANLDPSSKEAERNAIKRCLARIGSRSFGPRNSWPRDFLKMLEDESE